MLGNRIGGGVGFLAVTKAVIPIICSVAAGESSRALLAALDISALLSCLDVGKESAFRLMKLGASAGAFWTVVVAAVEASSANIAARDSSALATRYSGSTVGLFWFQSFSSLSGLRAPPIK